MEFVILGIGISNVMILWYAIQLMMRDRDRKIKTLETKCGLYKAALTRNPNDG